MSKAAPQLVNRIASPRVDEGILDRLRAGIRAGLRAGTDAIWPPRCVLCGETGDAPDNLCPGCRSELPWIRSGCRRCASPLPNRVDRCGACTRQPPAFDAAIAALFYRAPIDRLVQRFKFRRDLAAGRALAACLAAARLDPADENERRTPDRPQLLVPVPLHWRRRAGRGFNQADSLARDLAVALGGPPAHELLRRVRPTATQSALMAGGRRANVRAAFACAPLPPGLRHVALIDDVMTTGATLDECARTLKRAGVERVEAWVVARA